MIERLNIFKYSSQALNVKPNVMSKTISLNQRENNKHSQSHLWLKILKPFPLMLFLDFLFFFFFLSLNLNKKDIDFQVKESASYECHKSVYLLLKKEYFETWWIGVIQYTSIQHMERQLHNELKLSAKSRVVNFLSSKK